MNKLSKYTKLDGNTLMSATLNPIGFEYRMLHWKLKKNTQYIGNLQKSGNTQTK